MSESIFLADGERFVPTEQAAGPWDPAALHGGAPAALITAAFEAMEPRAELRIARLAFELLRPVPFQPLTLSTRVIRDGRRVQELAAELHAGDQLICRASALRVQEVPGELPQVAAGDSGAGERGDGDAPAQARMLGPDEATPVRFALDTADRTSFAASAMEMRFLDDPWQLGPARVWMRLRHPLVGGEPTSPLARLAATADFGNGVSAALPFERFLFINADLTIHLHRHPQGEWIGLDARTFLHPGGAGMAESVLHDVHGPVGRAFQTLVVGQR
jgi:hypothetical protein